MIFVTLCHPLLMVAYEKFEFNEFKKLLHGIMVISFRYNVIGKMQTNEMDKAYNKTAIKVYKNEIDTSNAALNDLKDLYLSDDEFRSYFELKSFSTANNQQKKIARYILYKIESQQENGIKTDSLIDDGSIEHILPENMNNHWNEIFNEDDHLRMVYMLGNLTLLEPKLNNREAGQKSFEDKKIIYQKSRYALSKQITGSEWNIQMIKHRQASLAKTAAGIWRK
jgi:hypothetical protein